MAEQTLQHHCRSAGSGALDLGVEVEVAVGFALLSIPYVSHHLVTTRVSPADTGLRRTGWRDQPQVDIGKKGSRAAFP